MQGPLADINDGVDNDRDGVIDEFNEEIIMSKFVYYRNVMGVPDGNPIVLDDYFQYLSGIWLDGLPITYGSDGRNQSNPPANFMFPDHTDPLFTNPWTMANAMMLPADMRFLQSAGPFTLLPGEVNYVSTAVVWARATSGGPLASLALLQEADSVVQSLFDNCFSTGLDEFEDGHYSIYPNPFNDQTTITFDSEGSDVELTIFDSSGNLIRRSTTSGDNFVVSKRDLRPGVYIFSLDGKKRTSGKLVIL